MENLGQKIQFQGEWRSYQKRVLDQVSIHMQDDKIHIVAAPGSGKTTLGIELIGRLGKPCLILSPSITIRDQWISRIKEAFLARPEDGEGLLSNNIKKAAPITAITYQALHSCMSKYKGSVAADPGENDEEKSAVTETVDYSDFDFFATMKTLGVQTICLDEAHHLRSEWWKALEEMMKKLPKVKVISLTATPPYDSTPAEWERYNSLCGPIDEEIIVPELVKEGSLCPHQDYVYFNMPTREEEQAVLAFREGAKKVTARFVTDKEFANVIKGHTGLSNPLAHAEKFLDNPAYLTSLLVYLKAAGIPFSKELVRILGANRQLPAMSPYYMEKLLQGFLYEDTESYFCDKVYREQMIAELKADSLIQKNKVGLVNNDGVNKLLRTSKGKINSILQIIQAEHKNMGEELRLLILTDFIKKEFLPAIGNPDKTVNELGVVPIFENIRRELSTLKGLRAGVLSGSVVIIPEEAREPLEGLMQERGIAGSVKECGAPGYYLVTVKGTEHTASSLLTELFGKGYIRVLIGTKSLLGEGWDSPCINSLILASFVGSFMLSNQMRGRAIRSMKGNPDKVSNIWHLICMEPKSALGSRGDEEESEDFKTLKRRFEGFLGVHYEEDVIENGLDRLSFISPPYTRNSLNEINQKMLSMAANRKALKKRWEESLTVIEKMEIADEAGVDQSMLKPGVILINIFAMALLSIFAGLLLWGLEFSLILFDWPVRGSKMIVALLGIICTIVSVIGIRYGAKLMKIVTPLRYMRSISKAVLTALQKAGQITGSHVGVGVEEGQSWSEGLACYAYLKGGTLREKNVFTTTLLEFFAIVDNQRYLLKAQGRTPKLCRYYCVPELFAKRKEDGELFLGEVKKYIGNYDLVYTRNPEGRKILLEARMKAFANKNDRLLNGKKRVKSAFE